MEEKNYICGGRKFAYNKGYIGLPVEIGVLPTTISIKGEVLQKKSSFHISLVCVKDIVEKYGNLEDKLLNLFCSFIKEKDISFIRYTGGFRLAQSKERKTVIALCEVSNLREFFASLEEKLGVKIPPQQTHITLYTLQPEVGIGLNSPAEMQAKSTPIDVPREIEHALGLV